MQAGVEHGATDRLWRGFRALPPVVQLFGWMLFWPLVAAAFLARRSGAGRALSAAAVVLFLGPMWANALVEDTDARVVQPGPGPARAVTPAPAPVPAPAPAPEPRLPAGVPSAARRGVVEGLVDGDTIKVRFDETGSSRDVGFLGIDVPVASAVVECGTPEARAFAEQRMPVGSTVYLLAGGADGYLHYVWSVDGAFFNSEAVGEGRARAALSGTTGAHPERIRKAESQAKALNRGIWGPPCDIDAPPPPPPPPPPAPPAPVAARAPRVQAPAIPAPAPRVQAPEPEPQSGCHPSYSGCVPVASDVDCAGGSGNGPAYTGRVSVIGPDEYDLDRNGDGIGCESN